MPSDGVELERASIEGNATAAPWPGRLPGPAPARVHPSLIDADVVDDTGTRVSVDARASLSAAPYQTRLGDQRWLEVVAWAGPWPLDERWWDRSRARRRARLQVVTDDGQAHVLVAEGGRWWLEATYD